MELIIETLTGDSFALKVNESDTILSIKNRIHKKDGIPVTNQFLVWRDQELSDFRSLNDYEITSGSKLKLILKLVGGPVNNTYGLSKLSSFEFLNRKIESILSSQSSRSIFEDSEEDEQENDESPVECEDDLKPSSSAKNLKDILRQIRKKQENKITLLIIQYENDIKLLTLPLNSSKSVLSSSSDEKIERLSELESNESFADDNLESLSKFKSDAKTFLPKILADIPKTNSFKPSKSSILYETSSDDYESETWSSSYTNNSTSPIPKSSSHHPRSHSSSNIWNSSSSFKKTTRLLKNTNHYYSSESFMKFDMKNKSCLTPSDYDLKEWIKSLSDDLETLNLDNHHQNTNSNIPCSEHLVINKKTQSPKSESPSFTRGNESTSFIPESDVGNSPHDKINRQDLIIKLSTSSDLGSSLTSVDQTENQEHSTTPVVGALNRCAFCRRKMGLIGGFLCSCGNTYCTLHRYAEMHNCQFDYKTEGRRILAHGNPQVLSSKLPKI